MARMVGPVTGTVTLLAPTPSRSIRAQGAILVCVAILPDFSAYGRKGARMRLRKLSPEQRSEIARKAALARHQRATKDERSESARRAVQVRWAKAKATKRKPAQRL